MKDPENQCHWRACFAFINLWEALTSINGVEKSKSITSEILEAYVAALKQSS